MKMMIGALALGLAVPAFGQAAPASDPHAAHSQMMQHGQHEAGKHDCSACCEKMKQSGDKMDCMARSSEDKPAVSDAGSHGSHRH